MGALGSVVPRAKLSDSFTEEVEFSLGSRADGLEDTGHGGERPV